MTEYEEVRDLLLAHQGRACAVCRFPFADDASGVVDHDHESGLVRGVLCGSCNVLESWSTDPVFMAYRSCPPVTEMGLVVQYERLARETYGFRRTVVRLPALTHDCGHAVADVLGMSFNDLVAEALSAYILTDETKGAIALRLADSNNNMSEEDAPT